MKARLFVTIMILTALASVICVWAFAQQGGKSDSAVHSFASGQASAGVEQGGDGAAPPEEITAYKGKDELRQEEVVPAYPIDEEGTVKEAEGMEVSELQQKTE